MTESARTCVLTIQGGGAHAIELLGQLQGVTGRQSTPGGQLQADHAFDVAGLSGSSAGAIIAALYWAGYSPGAILRLAEKQFSTAGREALFGPFPKHGLRSRLSEFFEFRSFSAVEDFLRRARAKMDGQRPLRLLPHFAPQTRRFLARILFITEAFFRVVRRQGMIDASDFARVLDELLKQSPKLEGDFLHHGPMLTFGDIQRTPALGMVPLMLMVTDVAAQRLLVVSSFESSIAHLRIADVVRASAGFPGLFKPMSLEPLATCCVDGGMISNSPSWVFGREYRQRLRGAMPTDDSAAALEESLRLQRLATMPWVHIALQLGPAAPVGHPLHWWAYVKSLGRLVSGAGRAHLESVVSTNVAVKRFTVVPDVRQAKSAGDVADVIDFSKLGDRDSLDAMFGKGRADAHDPRCIHPRHFEPPDAELVLNVLRVLVGMVQVALAEFLVPDSLVRANVFVPSRNGRLKLTYGWNMSRSDDRDLEVGEGRAVTGLCYLYGDAFLANLRDKLLDVAGLPSHFDPFRTPIHPDRTWLMCVPIIDPLDELACRHTTTEVLAMDSEGPLFGTLNVDACIRYDDVAGLPRHPDAQAHRPEVQLVFNAMKGTAREIGLIFNEPWLTEIDAHD